MIRGALLLDIEGTTTPIDFVHNVLFPYSRDNLDSYVHNSHDSQELKTDLMTLALERQREQHTDAPEYQDGRDPLPYLHWLISVDRKSPALKSLQGRIWSDGYKNGVIKGDVYPDVPQALKEWSSKGVPCFIYSSGSVLAQKLLFSHTHYGDLTQFIAGHFDTAVGPKTSPASYSAIAQRLSIPESAIYFVSDSNVERDAAAAVGMRCALSVRPGNPQQPANEYKIVTNLCEIDL